MRQAQPWYAKIVLYNPPQAWYYSHNMMEMNMTVTVEELEQSTSQLSLYEHVLATDPDQAYCRAVRVLYDMAQARHESLMRRWSEELFAGLPIRFEDDPLAD